MRQKLLILVCIIGMQTYAQELMRIIKNDGTTYDFSVNNVESMLFFTPEQINVVGDWVGYNDIAMRCYSLDQDGTMRYKYYSMTQSNNYEVEGEYVYNDNVLTLKYSGNTIPIEIISYNDTMLVSGSHEVYYKVLEPIYNMKTTDDPINIGNDGDVIKYVDNCVVGVEDNKIKPLKDGTGYAIVEDAVSKSLKAYRIDVSLVLDPPIDWSMYFKKSLDEIVEEFGKADQEDATKYTKTYTKFNAAIQHVIFTFSEDYSMVTKVQVSFYDEAKRQNYCDYIEKNYFLNKTSSLSTTYSDTEDSNAASVQIRVYDASVMCTIVYSDMKPTPVPTPVSVVDWTQYFKKSGDQIKTEFGSNPDITNDDEDESYTMVYYNYGEFKYVSFSFNKGFEKVTSIRVSFKDASSMQNYSDAISQKYILNSDSGTRKTYYDTDSSSTATVRVIIQSSSSSNYISYLDMSE